MEAMQKVNNGVSFDMPSIQGRWITPRHCSNIPHTSSYTGCTGAGWGSELT